MESKKKNGSYREQDVIEQLANDFHEKCYICEIKPVQDPQVEHRLPHHNRSFPTRVFDWNNLFYSCSHCNSVKNNSRYEEGIIDYCGGDVLPGGIWSRKGDQGELCSGGKVLCQEGEPDGVLDQGDAELVP